MKPNLPNWRKIFDERTRKIVDILNYKDDTGDFEKKILEIQENYVYWDKFKYNKFPQEFTPEEVWTYIKFKHRTNGEKTPVRTSTGEKFSFNFIKKIYKQLSFIDTHSSGFISTLGNKPTSTQKDRLIISGLSEEAIASSQLEGANTTRRAAKEMLYSGRNAKTKDEKMILNNYKVMMKIDEWKELDLSKDMLLEIQALITNGTIKDKNDSGRFRKDEDNIVVQDAVTGEVVYIPPKETVMEKELERLISYANTIEDETDFVHPVLKAIILHFWLAYLHPFPDGNGRTARALFYWYLIKKDYWLFNYLSVSKVIKESRVQYDNAFLHTEHDDNDLTYFIIYKLKVICKSIINLSEHYNKKLKETEENKKFIIQVPEINTRQISLIKFLEKNPEEEIDIKKHQTKHGIVYETARRDLQGLTEKGLLVEGSRARKKVFIANRKAISNLIRE